MKWDKHIWIKPLILIAIAMIVLIYSYYKNQTALDSCPEIASIQTLLRSSKPLSAAELNTAWGKAENALMRKKEYDNILRLAEIMRKSGKLQEEQIMFLNFSEYSAYFFSKQYPKAMGKLDELLKSPKTATEVRGAIAGEKMRCIAAMKGITEARMFFEDFLRSPELKQEMLVHIYNTGINLLFQYGEKEKALLLIVEAEKKIPRHGRFYLERLGGVLIREPDPETTLHRLMPSIAIHKYCIIMNFMADEFIKNHESDKALAILNRLQTHPYVPKEVKNMAAIKVGIVKEKQKELILKKN